MQKPFLLAMLGIIGFAAPSSAETVAQIAAKWGIVGIWQKDCNAPVTQSNDQQAFVIRGGKLYLDRSTGDTHDSNPIAGAAITRAGELSLRLAFPVYKQNRENVHARTDDGRDHIVLNRNVDTDEYTVRNGVLLSTGQPTPWMTRCD